MFLTFCAPHRLEAEGERLADLVRHLTGDANAPGIGELLKPRGDVDALAVPVRPLDNHLAEVDADPHVDTVIFGQANVSLRHPALDVGGAFDRVDDARELGQKPVAHQLEDDAPMRRDRRLDQFDPVRLKPLEGPRLVQLHQPAVADDICGEDGGELPFHERALFGQHETQIRVEMRLSKLLDAERHALMMRPPNSVGNGENYPALTQIRPYPLAKPIRVIGKTQARGGR